jgi:hypothetical protein
VAQRELLIHVDPGAAWELIVKDEARCRTWNAQIDDRLRIVTSQCAAC